MQYIPTPDGRIYSLKTNRYLKPSDNGRGYQHVVLRMYGRSIDVYVHRYIAEHLLPNPLNLEEVHHKDGDKSNNALDNLEWVTSSQNKLAEYSTGRRKRRGVKATHTNGPTFFFESVDEASAELGYAKTSIRNACNGTKEMCGYFYMEYV